MQVPLRFSRIPSAAVHPGREEALMRRAQRSNDIVPPSGSVKSCPPEVPRRTAGMPAASAVRTNAAWIRHGEDVASLILAEPEGMAGNVARVRSTGARRCRSAMAISASATSSPPSDTSWQARIVPFRICGADEVAVGAFHRQIHRRRRAVLAAGDLAQPERLAEPALSSCRSARCRARAAARGRPPAPRRPARRGRRSPASAGSRGLGLVVEADIAGHDREVERLAGGGHAADGGGELAHDLRASPDCRNSCCR